MVGWYVGWLFGDPLLLSGKAATALGLLGSGRGPCSDAVRAGCLHFVLGVLWAQTLNLKARMLQGGTGWLALFREPASWGNSEIIEDVNP